jgi:hypothetical protein
VIHVDHVNDSAGLIDPISNAVLATTRSPLAVKWSSKRGADASWFLGQRAEDELDACSCNRLGEVFG